MPNWTDCKLTVSGDPVILKRFMDKASSFNSDDSHDLPAVICCEAFLPCPKELTDTMSGSYGIGSKEQAELEAKEKANLIKYGFKNWYDWEKANWGVKWGICDSLLRDDTVDDGYLTYTFRTPWTYPDKWLEFVAKEWPDLTFDLGYVLEGYEGCDRIVYEKGKLR